MRKIGFSSYPRMQQQQRRAGVPTVIAFPRIFAYMLLGVFDIEKYSSDRCYRLHSVPNNMLAVYQQKLLLFAAFYQHSTLLSFTDILEDRLTLQAQMIKVKSRHSIPRVKHQLCIQLFNLNDTKRKNTR